MSTIFESLLDSVHHTCFSWSSSALAAGTSVGRQRCQRARALRIEVRVMSPTVQTNGRMCLSAC
jgi:hypothetical protein